MRLFLLFLLIIADQGYSEDIERHRLAQEFKLSSPESLQPDQVVDDIRTLLHFYRNGYAGYKFHNPKLTVELEKAIAQLTTESNPAKLCQGISRILAKIPDGHLGAAINNSNCLPPSERTWTRQAQIGSNVAKPFPRSAEKPFRLTYVYKSGTTLPILGISRFPFFDSPVWQGFEDAVNKAKKHSSLVIDLRGNGGGDDRRGYQLAGLLLGKNATIPAEDHIERQRPETFLLFLNKLTHFIDQQKSEEEKQVYRDVKRTWEELYQKARDGKLEEYSINSQTTHFGRSVKAEPYKGHVYLLADAYCGSSCESSLKVLRTLPNATFIGENTAGVTHFGNQGLLVLPNSRIRVSMSTKYIKWGNNFSIEKVGHTPDVQAKPRRDPLVQIIDLIP